MPSASSSRRMRLACSALAVATVAGALGGCVEAGPEIQVGAGDVRNAIARGQLTSPRAATVALVSLDGAPDTVQTRFRQDLATAAAAREIAMTDAASAHYLVRGYLSAYPGDQGVTVAYTYDIFDAGAKRRQARIADTIDVPATSADPWSAVSDAVLSSLVARSADDLAVTLGGTPEAQANRVAIAPTASPTPVD